MVPTMLNWVPWKHALSEKLHAEGLLGSFVERYTHKGVRKRIGERERRATDLVVAEASAHLTGALEMRWLFRVVAH